MPENNSANWKKVAIIIVVKVKNTMSAVCFSDDPQVYSVTSTSFFLNSNKLAISLDKSGTAYFW